MPMQWTDPLTGRQMLDSHPNHQICWDCKKLEVAQFSEAFMMGVRFGKTEEQVADLIEFQRIMITSALEDALAAIARGEG